MGISRFNPTDCINAFIVVVVFFVFPSAASVCFRCAASSDHSSLIVGFFAAEFFMELLLAAYSLTSVPQGAEAADIASRDYYLV